MAGWRAAASRRQPRANTNCNVTPLSPRLPPSLLSHDSLSSSIYLFFHFLQSPYLVSLLLLVFILTFSVPSPSSPFNSSVTFSSPSFTSLSHHVRHHTLASHHISLPPTLRSVTPSVVNTLRVIFSKLFRVQQI